MPPPTTAPETAAPDAGISLYIHIPFCLSKCPYCDFNTYQGIESQFGDFLTAVCAELDAWFRVLAHPPVNTVFLGGGTPSYLPAGAVARILDTVAAGAGSIPADAEITAECNPNDLTPQRCADLHAAGVNRISIGVQSMDNALLTMLGRRHDAAEAAEALRHCRRAGFNNISLDLMYGLPRQTLRQWQDTLHAALSLSPEHLSLYALTLEDGTPLRRWVTEGRLPEPDPDLAADMYDHARRALSAAGYCHYEISNWAFPGRQSRHNLAYWRNRQWLGVGPGAHSALAGIRFWTVRSPRDYAARARQWSAELTTPTPASVPPAHPAPGSIPSDRIALDRVAPASVAPDRVTPGSVPLDRVAPDSVPSDRVAPDSNALDPVAPDSVAPDRVAPASNAPDPVAPDSVAPDRVAPASNALDPVAPGSNAPDRVAPASNALDPVAPDSVPLDRVAPASVPPARVAPDSDTFDRVAPGSVAPDRIATDGVAPGNVTPDRLAPDQETPPPGAAWPAITETAIAAVPTVAGYEVIDPATAAAETMFLGLRLQEGIDLAEASTQTGADLQARYRQELADLTAAGLLHWETPTRIRLDKSAWLIANQIFARFL